ncbi:MAG: hypothetical protein K2N51_11985 [Lachnospiraceae bacterium]|nr:hypothetical protein [Lachnospiraceae bacterium]
MTENKAIEVLKDNFPKTCKMVDGRLKGGFDDVECDFGKALLQAILSLKEIQKYRAIGTIEFLTDMKSNYVEVLSDLRQYRKLGTVKELKELTENQLSGLELAEIAVAVQTLKKYQEIGTVEECQENKAIAEEAAISGKWIPCSKKLPEGRIDVLVSFSDHDSVIAWYSEVNKCWKNSSTDNVITSEVIAWQ